MPYSGAYIAKSARRMRHPRGLHLISMDEITFEVSTSDPIRFGCGSAALGYLARSSERLSNAQHVVQGRHRRGPAGLSGACVAWWSGTGIRQAPAAHSRCTEVPRTDCAMLQPAGPSEEPQSLGSRFPVRSRNAANYPRITRLKTLSRSLPIRPRPRSTASKRE